MPRSAKQSAPQSFFQVHQISWLLLGVVFVVFYNTLLNDYCMDDEIVTINHPLTSKGLAAIPEILKSPYFKADIYSYEYRPVVHISFAIEHQFLGESPFTSHAINLLLYLVLTWVAFNLLKRLFPEVHQLFLAAATLIFALHPTHTEVVASIKNRDEILALLFTLLAFIEGIKFIQGDKWWHFVSMLLLYHVALGSKATVIPFSLIIPLTPVLLHKETSPLRALLAALVLASTGTLWIEFLSLKGQIILSLLVVIIICLILFILKFRDIKNSFANFFSAKQEKNESFENETIFLKNVFEAWSHYKYYFLYFAVVNLSLYVVFPHIHYWIGALLLLSLIFLISPQLNHQRLAILFFSILLGQMYLLNFLKYPLVIQILIAVLAVLSHYFKVVSPYYLFVFLLPSIVTTQSLGSIMFLSLIYLYIRYNRIRLVRVCILLFTLFMAFLDVLDLFSSKFSDYSYIYTGAANLLFFFTLLIARFKKITQNKFIIFFILVISSYLVLKDFKYLKSSYVYSFKKKAPLTLQQTIQKTPAPKIVPTASYRPVLFAEFPLNLGEASLQEKIGLSTNALLRYVKLVLIPYPLSFYYGYKEIEVLKLSNPLVWLSLLIHLIMLAAAFIFWKKNVMISYGILFYLITISPFSAFLYPIPGVIADRYLLAPSLGYGIFLTALASVIFKIPLQDKKLRWQNLPSGLKYLISAVLICYSFISFSRNRDWKDRLTLFRHDIKHVENSAQAHNLLAFHLSMEAQKVSDIRERNAMVEEAIHHFRRATEIWPAFLNATYDLGRSLEMTGRWREAANTYLRAFQIDTSFTDALFRAGIMYEQMQMLDSAIECYNYVIRVNPENAATFNNLSFIYFRKKEYLKAIDILKKAYSYHPQNSDPLVNIGKTFLNMGQRDSALVYFERAYPYRKQDVELIKILYQLWYETEGQSDKSRFYYGELQRFGVVR
ncbi:MAG: tetratricopeptide repeat protein [Chitinophagales bacterium]|nr:tetratricopeptide repeat protein [Chitinophagales bacterium]